MAAPSKAFATQAAPVLRSLASVRNFGRTEHPRLPVRPVVPCPLRGHLVFAKGVTPMKPSARWQRFVDTKSIAALALVSFIATQMGTFFGYVFPAIGLPVLPWPLYNGLLATTLNVDGADAL